MFAEKEQNITFKNRHTNKDNTTNYIINNLKYLHYKTTF